MKYTGAGYQLVSAYKRKYNTIILVERSCFTLYVLQTKGYNVETTGESVSTNMEGDVSLMHPLRIEVAAIRTVGTPSHSIFLAGVLLPHDLPEYL